MLGLKTREFPKESPLKVMHNTFIDQTNLIPQWPHTIHLQIME